LGQCRALDSSRAHDIPISGYVVEVGVGAGFACARSLIHSVSDTTRVTFEAPGKHRIVALLFGYADTLQVTVVEKRNTRFGTVNNH